jgi:DNA-binding transcriptional ArsR family regulator
MEQEDAIAALAALSQPTRLEAFRRLVAAGPDGMPAGLLADRLAVPQNTLSAHLAVLVHAGLAESRRAGRSIVYRARLDRLRETVTFLLKDCCGGRPEICMPVAAELAACCPDKETCQ